jgi:hypothetical protein
LEDESIGPYLRAAGDLFVTARIIPEVMKAMLLVVGRADRTRVAKRITARRLKVVIVVVIDFVCFFVIL